MQINNVSCNQNFGAVKLADINMIAKFQPKKFKEICASQATNPINIYVQEGAKSRLQYHVGNKIIKTHLFGCEMRTLKDAVYYANCLAKDLPINLLEYTKF